MHLLTLPRLHYASHVKYDGVCSLWLMMACDMPRIDMERVWYKPVNELRRVRNEQWLDVNSFRSDFNYIGGGW